MSDPEDLKQRLTDAEKQFGLTVAPAADGKSRLADLTNAVVDRLWQNQRDTEQLSFERDAYHSLLSSLVATFENGNLNQLREAMLEAAARMDAILEAGGAAPSAAVDPVELESGQAPEPEPESKPGPEPEPEPAQGEDGADLYGVLRDIRDAVGLELEDEATASMSSDLDSGTT